MIGADATRTPPLDELVAADYLWTRTENLLSSERAADVRLHVPVSIIGMERVPARRRRQDAPLAGLGADPRTGRHRQEDQDREH